MPLTLYSVGHSTRTAEEFLSLLREFEVDRLVDIRQHPGSRRLPQFNRESLARSLGEAGVAYEWLVALGGRRRSSGPDSLNQALRNPSFRSYADHMMSSEFRSGVDQLIAWAKTSRTAIMCAEAVYWRCHRRLVSDCLLAIGIEVQHIMGPGQLRPHALTPGAVIRDKAVSYPAEPLFS